ncbi:MAG: hypothetical protein KJN64_09420 [Ignavibacteria bacterium]|nr:hypothetical protein [Ignavibacteria bacterium]MBT8382899.1 hypothetical protein [Ignavibacteria bacterium]MBT8391720.1 hypothetical protein [Ignavibacteria bacterium]NNJ53829.1 hypothetical protein [Ignavibacteriaceae bacterium]NNL20093.1 hypothetical protein [Ignavibacteriaceae bacterium]
MNNKQKIALLIGFIFILAFAGYWQLSGGEILSKDGVWIEKEQSDLDKLLGLEPEMEFKEQFIIGLIPHTLGFTGIVVAITGILLFFLRTKKKENK